jgi:hypothetical protein
MASGLLGKSALTASTYTSIYQATAGKIATMNIRVTNRDISNSVTIRLAICPSSWTTGAAPANADYIETLDLVISAGGLLEETGVVVTGGEQVVAYTPSSSVTVRIHGFEQ